MNFEKKTWNIIKKKNRNQLFDKAVLCKVETNETHFLHLSHMTWHQEQMIKEGPVRVT